MNIGDLRVSGIKWCVCIWRMPLLSVSFQRKNIYLKCDIYRVLDYFCECGFLLITILVIRIRIIGKARLVVEE